MDVCSNHPPNCKGGEIIKTVIGIDIGKKMCWYCVMCTGKVILEEAKYPNTSKDAACLAARLKSQYGKCSAVCETTGNMTYKTYYAFEDEGIHIVMADAYHMKRAFSTGAKTDKINARKLALALLADMVPTCYIVPRKDRRQRDILRHRTVLVRNRTATVNRVHSLLDAYDVTISGADMYGKKALTQLKRLAKEWQNVVLQDHILAIENLNDRIKVVDSAVDCMAANSEDAQRLMSITGIDAFIAMTLVLEIGPMDRFPNRNKFVS